MRSLLILLLAVPHAAAQQKCDASQLDKLEKAIPQVLESQDVLTAEGLYEACGGALSPSLTQALHGLAQVDPQMRRLVALRALQAEHALWLKACPQGDAVLIHGIESADKEAARAALHKACALDWLSADEARRGGPAFELAILMHLWLEQHGETARARRFARALARVEPIPPPAPSRQLPRFEMEERVDVQPRSGAEASGGIGGGRGGYGIGGIGYGRAPRLQPLHHGHDASDQLVRSHLLQLSACRDRMTPPPRTLELNVTVDAEGKPTLSLKDECLRRVMQRWRWPKEAVELRYRVEFF